MSVLKTQVFILQTAELGLALAYPVVSANRKPSRRRFKLGATYGALLNQG
jgi:hypothetical protein